LTQNDPFFGRPLLFYESIIIIKAGCAKFTNFLRKPAWLDRPWMQNYAGLLKGGRIGHDFSE